MPTPVINSSDVYDAMLDGYWADAGNPAFTLRYAVATNSTTWTGYSGGGGGEPTDVDFSVLNSAQGTNFNAAMEIWDSYLLGSFNPGSSATSSDIRIAFTGVTNIEDAWGYAYLPGSDTPTGAYGVEGDIWINTQYTGQDFSPGTYNFHAMLHEIGHALGLDHSFWEAGDPLTDGIPAEFDNSRYTIMSYTQPDEWVWTFETDSAGHFTGANGGQVNCITPMMIDILVLQLAYGADESSLGNSTYTFDADLPALQTIYDAGGTDTWDLSGQTRVSIIDLTPGTFSSVNYYSVSQQVADLKAQHPGATGAADRAFIDQVFGDASNGPFFTWTDNVAIALNTTIENVSCGSGNDTVSGNDVGNTLRGNGGDDTLRGQSGNDVLDGGAGADRMYGGVGNDTFVVNNTGDAISENLDAGTDTVKSSISYKLSNNVEKLTLLGASAINGTGNDLNNTITGNDGKNTLDGVTGNDTLIGGNGDDTYIVNSSTDVVSETSATGGADLVKSSTTWLLGANLENLTLTSSKAVNGTGNTLDNAIIGNSAINKIAGGVGHDVLTGGGGADVFIFSSASAKNSDTITDFATSADKIYLENGTFTTLAEGALSADAFYSGSAAHDADDRIIYNSANGNLYYDKDGDGAGGQTLLVTLTTHPALGASDIVVI